MAGKLNLKINQGETFKHILKWKDANEQLIDLTGMSALMHVRSKISDTTPALVLSSDSNDNPDGNITLGGTAGTISLYISSEITKTIEWVSGVYDLEITDALGDVTRLIEGSIAVSKEVTR